MEDPAAEAAWTPGTRNSFLSFRQKHWLPEPEVFAGEGCPPEARGPVIGREGDISVLLTSDLKVAGCLARSNRTV